jgi:hypothetical protein
MANWKSKRSVRFRSMAASSTPFGSNLACGKICHPSRSAAKSAIRRTMGKGSMTEKELMREYYCEKCSAWHAGHERYRAKEATTDA